MSWIITTVVLFLGCRKSTEQGYCVAKSTRKLNRWVCKVQGEVFSESTNLEDDNKESKIGFMGLMSIYCTMTAMNRGNTSRTQNRRGVLKIKSKNVLFPRRNFTYPQDFAMFSALAWGILPTLTNLKFQISLKTILKHPTIPAILWITLYHCNYHYIINNSLIV